MRFVVKKNVRPGQIGLTGLLALKHVAEEQELKCENVYFKIQGALKHCVQEKKKRLKNVILKHALTGPTGQNGHLALKVVEGEGRSEQENALS